MSRLLKRLDVKLEPFIRYATFVVKFERTKKLDLKITISGDDGHSFPFVKVAEFSIQTGRNRKPYVMHGPNLEIGIKSEHLGNIVSTVGDQTFVDFSFQVIFTKGCTLKPTTYNFSQMLDMKSNIEKAFSISQTYREEIVYIDHSQLDYRHLAQPGDGKVKSSSIKLEDSEDEFVNGASSSENESDDEDYGTPSKKRRRKKARKSLPSDSE
eukprot:TRINITY_DN6403_c0_g1_i3.p2 TRINITY_DN6403_c0_g1~~TRINITY_DN6403_c0_g1_i3.p2  ORF type:complete len:211 (+),score=72.85 TRINITY_DN6403_c0_g1_i3:769-1401(+)